MLSPDSRLVPQVAHLWLVTAGRSLLHSFLFIFYCFLFYSLFSIFNLIYLSQRGGRSCTVFYLFSIHRSLFLFRGLFIGMLCTQYMLRDSARQECQNQMQEKMVHFTPSHHQCEEGERRGCGSPRLLHFPFATKHPDAPRGGEWLRSHLDPSFLSDLPLTCPMPTPKGFCR